MLQEIADYALGRGTQGIRFDILHQRMQPHRKSCQHAPGEQRVTFQEFEYGALPRPQDLHHFFIALRGRKRQLDLAEHDDEESLRRVAFLKQHFALGKSALATRRFQCGNLLGGQLLKQWQAGKNLRNVESGFVHGNTLGLSVEPYHASPRRRYP